MLLLRLSKRLSSHSTTDTDTLTPFGRAFYKREASFFVLPYAFVIFLNFAVSSLSAAYWANTAVSTAQFLRLLLVRAPQLHLYAPVWYRTGVLYGLIAIAFVVLLSFQSVFTMAWVVATKWLVIGRRAEGSYSWDKSSYCKLPVNSRYASSIYPTFRSTMAGPSDSQPPPLPRPWDRRSPGPAHWFSVFGLVRRCMCT